MPSQIQHMCTFPNFTQQAYRYGIALSCIGVLLNWLGVAQAYIEPVRYLGVGLVIIGSFLIIAAMCRWMFLSPHTTTVHEVSSDGAGDLHVITVPMGRGQSQSCTPGTSSGSQGKPPDYFLVTEKPPSYEEAMSMLPPYPATHSGSLQLNTEGGLEDFLVPHQVPESQPEGAIGGLLQQSDSVAQQTADWNDSGSLLNVSTSPPAYSQCASQFTNGNSNNTTMHQEGNTSNKTATTSSTDNRIASTTSSDNRTVNTTSTDNSSSPVLALETECVTPNTGDSSVKPLKISDSVQNCQKTDCSQSLPNDALP